MTTIDKRFYEAPQASAYQIKPDNALLQTSCDALLLEALSGRGDYVDGGDPFSLL